ncbi:hypothetical protein WA158_001554 [Blastocystis sp. Blastoise]
MSSYSFIKNNLELFGFGNKTQGFFSTFVELFENSVDALEINTYQQNKIIKISINQYQLEVTNEKKVSIEISDNGVGIVYNEIIPVCTQIFNSTKQIKQENDIPELKKEKDMVRSFVGKFGIGLKAVLMYFSNPIFVFYMIILFCSYCQDLVLLTTTTREDEYIRKMKIGIDEKGHSIVDNVHHIKKHDVMSGTTMIVRNIDYSEEGMTMIHKYLNQFSVYNKNITISSSISMDSLHSIYQYPLGISPKPLYLTTLKYILENETEISQEFYRNQYKIQISLFCCESDQFKESSIYVYRYIHNKPLLTTDISCCMHTLFLEETLWGEFGIKTQYLQDNNQEDIPEEWKTTVFTVTKQTNASPFRLYAYINISPQHTMMKYTDLKKNGIYNDPLLFSFLYQSLYQSMKSLKSNVPHIFFSFKEKEKISMFTTQIPCIANSVMNIIKNSSLEFQSSCLSILYQKESEVPSISLKEAFVESEKRIIQQLSSLVINHYQKVNKSKKRTKDNSELGQSKLIKSSSIHEKK